MAQTVVDAETKLRLAASTGQAITLGVQDAKILSTLIAADHKRIEELEEINKVHRDLRSNETGVLKIIELKEETIRANATIERLRGALEPFAPPYDIIDNDCYGIFLGGLIKRNFIDARQALDRKEE